MAGHYMGSSIPSSLGDPFNYAEDILLSRGININSRPPMEDPTLSFGYKGHGVVKISNIPFNLTVDEVNQFMSRIASTPMIIPHHTGYPIHIIMEKPTGKTMDCFVEFPNQQASKACVDRFEIQNVNKRGKLGTRTVHLDVSSQAELMQALFPRAHCVEFDEETGQPEILPCHDNFSEGFRGFYSIEEMVGIVKFTENPARSPFVLRCQQRVFESMISTLYKYPWAASDQYTVASRDMLFGSYIQQLKVLCSRVGPSYHAIAPTYGDQTEREVGLSRKLFLDFMFAGLNVPSFSGIMKLHIRQQAREFGQGITLPALAHCWPFYTLAAPVNIPENVLCFWLEMIRLGHEIMTINKLPTGFEKYCRAGYNQNGVLVFEFTEAGVQLKFNEAINLERALMEMLADKGRMQFCVENQIHYEGWSLQTVHDAFENARMKPINESDSGMLAKIQNEINAWGVNNGLARNEKGTLFNPAQSSIFESLGFDEEFGSFNHSNNGPPSGRQNRHDRTPNSHSQSGLSTTLDPETPSFHPSRPILASTGHFRSQLSQHPENNTLWQNNQDFNPVRSTTRRRHTITVKDPCDDKRTNMARDFFYENSSRNNHGIGARHETVTPHHTRTASDPRHRGQTQKAENFNVSNTKPPSPSQNIYGSPQNRKTIGTISPASPRRNSTRSKVINIDHTIEEEEAVFERARSRVITPIRHDSEDLGASLRLDHDNHSTARNSDIDDSSQGLSWTGNAISTSNDSW